jgi:ATPase subunit of ABC transporter with duplicated ATPase domains
MISFSNINKQYGKQLLFVDASFQLNPGEKVGLVGPNGAGKTTLFRMVVGEETPDEGAAGRNPVMRRTRCRIGCLVV